MKAPHITKELVDYLASLYPDRCPDPSLTEREIWMAAGAARVVRRLRIEHDSQTKQALGGR